MSTLNDLFQIEYGNKFDMNKMTRTDRLAGVAFVGRIGGLNGKSGIAGFVEPLAGVKPYSPGLLTVALGGSRLLSTYVQQLPFYTAQNVAVLSPRNEEMSTKERLFYAMCIRANAFRYSAFGREANRTLGTLEVPDDLPDWVSTAQIPTYSGLSRAIAPDVDLNDPHEWPRFVLEDLFTVKKGRRVTKAQRVPGTTRFIGASEKNNGITDMCDLEPMFDSHCLTVPYNGSVGFAFYQDRPFCASDDVQVLIPKEDVTRWALLFVATIIRVEKTRFSYGYKWNMARMKKTTIRLPADASGEPDWAYMDSIMRGLPFSAAVASRIGDVRNMDEEEQASLTV